MLITTKCRHCGAFVSHDILFNAKGNPYWICPFCGAKEEDHSWYKYVNQEEANQIIEHRSRRGLFVQEADGKFVGIDNTTGDAWVEEFPDLTECLKWLADKQEEAYDQN